MLRRVPLKPGKPLQRKTPLQPGSKRLKSRHRAIGAPTKAEKAQQDKQRAHGCAMCWLLGVVTGLAVRVHHRTLDDKHGALQLGQDATCGLCDWHHQGVPRPGFNTEAMRVKYGPSLYHHKRAFVELLLTLLGERSTAALQRYQDDLIAGRTPVVFAPVIMPIRYVTRDELAAMYPKHSHDQPF